MLTIQELSQLKGRRALITGATGYLGKVIAETLAELGADLILVDRPGANFDSLSADLIQRWGVSVAHRSCDLELQDDRRDLVAWVKGTGVGLNILVNNAAFVGTSKLDGWAVPFEEQSLEVWRRALEVNLTAIFELCQSLASDLKQAEGSNIINIASIYGSYGPDNTLYAGTEMANPAAYAASKGGLIQLTRWLATTLAPSTRVNSIAPGGIFRNQPDLFVERYKAKTPLARMAEENDIRGAIAYLSSDMASYVTGQNLSVDGGWGIW